MSCYRAYNGHCVAIVTTRVPIDWRECADGRDRPDLWEIARSEYRESVARAVRLADEETERRIDAVESTAEFQGRRPTRDELDRCAVNWEEYLDVEDDVDLPDETEWDWEEDHDMCTDHYKELYRERMSG